MKYYLPHRTLSAKWVLTFPYSTFLASLLSAGLLQGCGSSLGEGTKSADAGKCFAPEEHAPVYEPLKEVKYPKSALWLHARIPTVELSERIAQEIPATLAAEKDRPVGAPGNATYQVTRGVPSIHQLEDELEVRVPISAKISMCKPFGSTCIQYGSCSPRLEARFTVGTELGKNYEFPPPEGSISATKKCVIGLDVTSELEKIARKEVAQVQRQIKEKWPALKPDAKKAWGEFAHPISIAEGTCLHMAPRALVYSPPRIHTDGEIPTLRAALGIQGTLMPAPDCSESLKPRALPAPKKSEQPPLQSEVWVPEVIALEELKKALLSSLNGKWDTESELVVLDVTWGENEIALLVETTGQLCGRYWLSASLHHTAGASALTLKNTKLVVPANAKQEAPSAAVDQLMQYLESKNAVPLASEAWFSPARTDLLKVMISAALPDGVELEISDPMVAEATVLVAISGLYVLHPVTTKLVVTTL